MYGLFLIGLLAVVTESSILPSDQMSLKVSTSSGILHGKRITTLNQSVRLFLGVPYAQPPLGNLRFKPPVEFESSDALREASRFAASCKQKPHMTSVISPLLSPNQAIFDEDCLYLNIYVPESESIETPLPVMVWLPGEGFDYADPQQFDGSFLAVEGKVIVVTVNYRLSAFGFLSMNTDDAPGNVGLLDQKMALKWVKQNIAKLGGDPEKVTLFGRFTGSMSAAIHAFSSVNDEKLFNRVILQSGIPIDSWVIDHSPVNTSLSLAKSLNCPTSDPSEAIKCIKQKSSDEILDAALPLRFRPVVDHKVIDEAPLKAVSKSHYKPLDVMIGLNEDEGSLCIIALSAMQSPLYQDLVTNAISEVDFYHLLEAQLLDFYKNKDQLTSKLISYKYLSRQENLRDQFIEFCGDMLLKAPSIQLANKLAEKHEKIFVYEFQHRPSFSIYPEFISAAHGDDVLFTMGLPLKKIDLSTEESQLTKQMVAAMSNFARKGDPNTGRSKEWPNYTAEDQDIMTFSTKSRSLIQESGKSRQRDVVVFWQEILPVVQEQRHCSLVPRQE